MMEISSVPVAALLIALQLILTTLATLHMLAVLPNLPAPQVLQELNVTMETE